MIVSKYDWAKAEEGAALGYFDWRSGTQWLTTGHLLTPTQALVLFYYLQFYTHYAHPPENSKPILGITFESVPQTYNIIFLF